MSMIVKRSDAPAYLHRSEFYISLSEADDGEIAVPEDCFKLDAVITDADSLRHLLTTLRFWIINDIMVEVFECSRKDKFFAEVARDFYSDMPYLKVLQDLKLKNRSELHTAVSAGCLVAVKYLFEKAFTPENIDTIRSNSSHEFTAEAAGKGHLSCLMYLHSMNCSWGSVVTQGAALAGHVNCLKYAHENGCEWEAANMAEWACWGGSAECLQYVMEHGCPLRSDLVPLELIHKDNILCVQYLRTCGVSWPSNAMLEALKHDSPKCLVYMLSTGLRFHADMIPQVSSEACLQVIHDSGFLWEEGCSARLAHTGNVPLLRYLHKLGCPCGDRTWREGVVRNKTDVLLYFHSEGFKLTSEHAAFAAGFSLQMLEFHHSLGCPWDETTVAAAIERVQLDCLVYAIDHGCMAAPDVCRVVGSRGYFQTLCYLHSKGYLLHRFEVTDTNRKCAEFVEKHLLQKNDVCIVA